MEKDYATFSPWSFDDQMKNKTRFKIREQTALYNSQSDPSLSDDKFCSNSRPFDQSWISSWIAVKERIKKKKTVASQKRKMFCVSCREIMSQTILSWRPTCTNCLRQGEMMEGGALLCGLEKLVPRKCMFITLHLKTIFSFQWLVCVFGKQFNLVYCKKTDKKRVSAGLEA